LSCENPLKQYLVGIGWQVEVISGALGGELRSQGGDLNVGPRS